jgi:quinoprotein dehydrogenase-associated probable ABC transporter substrate-binding protein
LLVTLSVSCAHSPQAIHEAEAIKPDPGVFRICAEPDNLPMSDQSSNSGFEIEVGKILAAELKRNFEVTWVPQRDRSYFRETIDEGRCDAILDVPQGFKRLLLTKPWYRTSFEFVTRADLKPPLKSFDDPRLKKMRIGIPATGLGETPPISAIVGRHLEKQIHPYMIFDSRKLVDDVRDGGIDVAILWGPFASWWAHEDQAEHPLVCTPTPAKDGKMAMSYEITIGLAKNNQELKAQLEQALQNKRDEIRQVLANWRVPLTEQ